MGTRTPIWAGAAAFVTALGTMLAVGPVTAGAASSPADQGVTAKTIAVSAGGDGVGRVVRAAPDCRGHKDRRAAGDQPAHGHRR